MRHGWIPALGLAALALTACAGSTVSDLRPAPPPSLTAACARPVALPDRAITQGEAEVFWGRDRRALRACGSRHAGLVDWTTMEVTK